MTREQKIQNAIALLEKVTGKKVILEFPETAGEVPAAPSEQPINKRREGARKAIQTKGFDDWTKEQYAVVYFLVKYGKRAFPEPYRSLPLKEIAASANVKLSTLQMNAENVRYLLRGESGLQSSSPKSEEFVAEFEQMSQDQVVKLCHKAFEAVRMQADLNNNKAIQGKVSVASLSPEKRAAINAKRAERGLPPLAEAFKAMNQRRIAEGKEPITLAQFKEAAAQIIKNRIEESTGKKVELKK